MRFRKKNSWILIGFLLWNYCCAQVPLDSIVKPKPTSRLVAVPILYFEPETHFGLGVAGNYKLNFTPESDGLRPSNIQFAVSMTQLRQAIISFPFQLWFKKEKYNVYGEANFYKYNYLFFGVGNHNPPGYKERYSLNFPRLRLNVLKRVARAFYAGIRYSFDDFHMHKLDPNGELISGQITGGKGGRTSGIGIEAKYDGRDKPYYPTKGYYAEFFTQSDSKLSGSDFTFQKISLDASTYYTIFKRHTFAFNFFTSLIHGDPAFNQMSLLGGPKRMRGFYEGRYRDKNAWIVQAEYRVLIYKKFGAVVFSGIGSVSDNISDYINPYVRFTYGAGGRYTFDTAQHFNIRFDVGIGNNHANYYLTIGEAF